MYKIIFISLALALAACSNKGANDPKADEKARAVKAREESEAHVVNGEVLIAQNQALDAIEEFDQAVAADSTHIRAQFYAHLFAPVKYSKGILKRIRPLATSTASGKIKYEKDLKSIRDLRAKRFLLDGPEDILTESDAQAYLDELYTVIDNSRLYFKSIRSETFSVFVHQLRGENDNAIELKLNRADIEYFQHSEAGLMTYIAFYTAYDFSGAVETADLVERYGMNPMDAYKQYLKNARFGTLRSTQKLSQLLSLGLDVVEGAKWVLDSQDLLCPNGSPNPNNRPGYLFSEGFCIKDSVRSLTGPTSAVDAIDQATRILSGQLVEASFWTTRGTKYTTEIRPAAPLMSPLNDFRDLTFELNECGHLAKVSDDTLVGVFPKADANVVISGASDCVN